MSKLETNTIDTVSGTTNLVIGSTNTSSITLGASGDTITVPNGALTGQNYPSFYAYRSSNQSISSATTTKIEINAEVFDTDNCYDPSTNYRFTPNKAGKYFVHGSARGDAGGDNLNNMNVKIVKNGNENGTGGVTGGGMIAQYNNAAPNRFDNMSMNVSGYFDMDGISDYIELYISISDSSGNPTVIGNGVQKYTTFGAYRIGA
jgi:hypothetical protein